jgi:hypothetical protein
MVKLMYLDTELNTLQIAFSDFITESEDNPCEILIYLSGYDPTLIRLTTNSVEETTSLMEMFFECDKINLYQIGVDNPSLTIIVETEDLDEYDLTTSDTPENEEE